MTRSCLRELKLYTSATPITEDNIRKIEGIIESTGRDLATLDKYCSEKWLDLLMMEPVDLSTPELALTWLIKFTTGLEGVLKGRSPTS